MAFLLSYFKRMVLCTIVTNVCTELRVVSVDVVIGDGGGLTPEVILRGPSVATFSDLLPFAQ